jgi:SAM-dependent methyltransferase
MKKSEKDATFSAHLAEACSYHSRMLSDGPRNRGLRAAIEKYVNENTSFLDVGSGTGIWAILAAKLGAKRVVAIEIEECFIPMIFKHAQENGVADRIEIIHGNVDDVKLRGKFDVIVSEIFGRNVYGEATTRSFINVRECFLAPGGVIIPQWMKMYIAPLLRSNNNHSVPTDLPLTTDYLNSLRLNYGRLTSFEDSAGLEFAGEPKLLTGVDYRTIEKPLSSGPWSAEWDLEDVSKVDSFLIFSISQFAPGIELNALESKTWALERYDFDPFEIGKGTIRFSYLVDPKNASWTISLPSNPEVHPQTYSPIFAFTRTRMAEATTPYSKTRRSKSRASK